MGAALVTVSATTRAGGYNRLAEPDWADPLDTSCNRELGGRWNAPGTVGVLHLNGSRRMARLQADHKLAGHPYRAEDLEPDGQHDLVEVTVAEVEVQDCVREASLRAVGLPGSYPTDEGGQIVGWERCRPVGAIALAAGLSGVACRSVVTGSDGEEELALFESSARERVEALARVPFTEWYFEP